METFVTVLAAVAISAVVTTAVVIYGRRVEYRNWSDQVDSEYRKLCGHD